MAEKYKFQISNHGDYIKNPYNIGSYSTRPNLDLAIHVAHASSAGEMLDLYYIDEEDIFVEKHQISENEKFERVLVFDESTDWRPERAHGFGFKNAQHLKYAKRKEPLEKYDPAPLKNLPRSAPIETVPGLLRFFSSIITEGDIYFSSGDLWRLSQGEYGMEGLFYEKTTRTYLKKVFSGDKGMFYFEVLPMNAQSEAAAEKFCVNFFEGDMLVNSVAAIEAQTPGAKDFNFAVPYARPTIEAILGPLTLGDSFQTKEGKIVERWLTSDGKKKLERPIEKTAIASRGMRIIDQ